MRRLILPDALRAAAVLLMVSYHLLFDLSYFWGFGFDVTDALLWRIFIPAVASTFLLVSGMSAWIAGTRNPSWKRAGRRAGIVLVSALLVSLVTRILVPDAWIRFGILHLIGVTMLCTPFFVRRSSILTGVTGTIMIVIGIFFAHLSVTHEFLLPFGLKAPSFSSLDYYPLLPWSGVMLLGIALAPFVLARFPATYDPHGARAFLLLPGRHALAIYLLHQPLLFAVLSLTLGWPAL